MYEMDIRRIMGDAYADAGRYKEAAETYRVAVLKCDSINKATLRMNEETVQANYRIQKALLEKEIGAKRFWQIAVGGASLFVILLVGECYECPGFIGNWRSRSVKCVNRMPWFRRLIR